MGRQWKVGEPKGGGFGSSDHFETPATPEEWFCLPAVDKWRMGRQWPVGEPKGCVFGVSDHFETPVAPEEWFWLPGVNHGGWVDSSRLVGQKVASSGSVTILRHRFRRRSGSGCQRSTMVDGSTATKEERCLVPAVDMVDGSTMVGW